MKFVLAGAGNMATHLGKAMTDVGHRSMLVFSRSENQASALAESLNCPFTLEEEKVNSAKADMLFMAIPDDGVEKQAKLFKGFQGIVVHTAGSVSISVLKKHFSDCGIFYPLQSFSKGVPVDFQDVPICIESSNEKTGAFLKQLAGEFSNKVVEVSEEQRFHLHMAAVIVNNFSNYLLSEASEILSKQGVNFSLLEPLARETIRKAFLYGPEKSQTGPAKRGDLTVLENHYHWLQDPGKQKLYRFLTEAILQKEGHHF